MSLTVRPLDVSDDAELRAAHRIYVAAETADRPFAQPYPFQAYVAGARYQSPQERQPQLVAFDGDEMVGAAGAWLQMQCNTSQMWCEVAVAPPQRRRGIGSALMEGLLDVAREHGRTVLLGGVHVPYAADRAMLESHPYRRFATAHGFKLSDTEVRRRVTLPVPPERMADLWSASQPRWEGRYAIETFVDGIPERLAQSYCDLYNLLGVDAPTGETEFEPESMDPEELRRVEALIAEQGRCRVTAVALTPPDEDGKQIVAAYSDLAFDIAEPAEVHQWGTYVHREHRGRALGMAVKIANLRRMVEANPAATHVDTTNSEANAYMVDINVALGFEPLELVQHLQRMLR